MKITKVRTIFCAIASVVVLFSCSNNNNEEQQSDQNEIYYIPGTPVPDDMSLDSLGIAFLMDYNPQCLNTVAGHKERDTIFGKFNGRTIDTLRVETRKVKKNDSTETVEYYVVASRKTIPEIKINGTPHRAPKLVCEGDLDGNGTDEWGYLATGVSSTWRTYSVFTLKKNRWYYLLKNDRLETTDWFRCSGNEILEKGGKKGFVKINYGYSTTSEDLIGDTIVKATFVPIKK